MAVDMEADPGAPPAEAYLLALASLPEMTPNRLLALVDDVAPPVVWARLSTRVDPGVEVNRLLGSEAARVRDVWVDACGELEPAALWAAHARAGVAVLGSATPGYPEALLDDPARPAALFAVGPLDALDGPRVAVVGTRDCTRYGRDLAFAMGRDLAAAGVRVVSGLALGIDGAAHAGALEARGAPPVAVVGSGLDVVYPRRNASLWRAVAEHGLLVSEHPLGRRARGWHFLARNRIIAALAQVVVLVESHARGGALQTAREAAERARPVLAVPGSVHSPASEGTNRLLGEAIPCLGVDDVVDLLGLVRSSLSAPDHRPAPDAADAAVVDAVGWEPASVEQLLLRTGLPLGALELALGRLEDQGWVARRGGWVERLAQ